MGCSLSMIKIHFRNKKKLEELRKTHLKLINEEDSESEPELGETEYSISHFSITTSIEGTYDNGVFTENIFKL